MKQKENQSDKDFMFGLYRTIIIIVIIFMATTLFATEHTIEGGLYLIFLFLIMRSGGDC